jgi:two-component system response regulator NreC
MTQPIRILIADDHALIRSGLTLLLSSQPDLQVVAECGTHDEVTERLAALPGGVDVITLDLTMPGSSPASFIEELVRTHPDLAVVVLTMHDDPSHARISLAAGAKGYVVKSAADRDLLEAIRIVARGGSYTGGTVAGEPVAVPKRPVGGGTPLDSLSDRERQVFVMVAEGHTSQQIADQVGLSVKTIESYRSRLMAKLGLANRAELTRLALDAGLIGKR